LTSPRCQISASIIAADLLHLGDEIREAALGGADFIHLDVMDGHFVPNITMGTPIVEALSASPVLPVDVHLMVREPRKFIPWFLRDPVRMVSFHWEAEEHPLRAIREIEEAGLRAGIAVNPGTSEEVLGALIPHLDFILVMTVNPGFYGQRFETAMLGKIARIREILVTMNSEAVIEVDGGITRENVGETARAGARIFVAGNAIFRQGSPRNAAAALREELNRQGYD
jgi:ribulose-phosphate 3-epimerase